MNPKGLKRSSTDINLLPAAYVPSTTTATQPLSHLNECNQLTTLTNDLQVWLLWHLNLLMTWQHSICPMIPYHTYHLTIKFYPTLQLLQNDLDSTDILHICPILQPCRNTTKHLSTAYWGWPYWYLSCPATDDHLTRCPRYSHSHDYTTILSSIPWDIMHQTIASYMCLLAPLHNDTTKQKQWPTFT